MTTLTSGWQEIYRTSKNTGYGNQYVIFYACAEENVSTNKSTVHTLVRTTIEGSGNYVRVSSWSAATDANSTSGGDTTWYEGDNNLLEAYWEVGHNADGTGSASIGFSFDATFNITHADHRETVGLQTIPRTSNVSLNKSTVTLNGRDGFVIYTNRASSSFSHKLFQNISGSWAQIASGVGDNYTWIPSTNFYANIGNSSKTYQIRCETWSGGTHIGDSQVNFTLASAGVHQCSLNTGSITLNGSNGVRIYTNRNSGSFTHSVEQNFSGSMAAISNGYNVTDYIDWAPPASYYTTIGGGSKSFTIRVHCKNNNGTYLGYTDVSFKINSAGADSVSLNNTNMTMGTEYTVSIAKRVSSFRHTVTWAFGSASGMLKTAKAVDTSVYWTPSTDLSAQIKSAMTGQGTVTCQTYYEDTPIGSTSVIFNLSVPSYDVVLGTPAITETGKDNTGTALTEKGVGATEVVAIMSIKRLVVSATTSYSATIKTISVSFGGSTKTASSGSFDDTFSGMMNGNLTITATDSRGRALASTYSKSYTFRDYFKPSVTSFDGDRELQTGDTGTLNAAGTFWNKTAGTTANVLTGAISISATGATTIVPTENKWTTAFDVSGVSYQNSYNFKIIVTDSFGFTAEKTYTLNASEPVLVKLKHTVRIYRNLVVSNIIKATKGYFTGDLKVGGKINASGTVTAPTFNGNLSGNAATATKTITSVSGSGAAELVRCNMADNDQFRILAGGTGSNAGYAEISTADDGNEPIYVRQYTGVFSNLVRTATLLDGSGNTSFPGTLYVAGKSLLDRTYPVGAIYFSVNRTSPASLFGGSWTNLTSPWHYVLLGDNTWDYAGNTGGSLTTGSTTLTANQSGLRSHSHQAYNRNWNVQGVSGGEVAGNSGGEIGSWGIQNTGGWNAAEGHTHSLDWMPYVEVYAWKRIG